MGFEELGEKAIADEAPRVVPELLELAGQQDMAKAVLAAAHGVPDVAYLAEPASGYIVPFAEQPLRATAGELGFSQAGLLGRGVPDVTDIADPASGYMVYVDRIPTLGDAPAATYAGLRSSGLNLGDLANRVDWSREKL